jgi:uncharacterized protein (TIGR04141 family)
MPDEFKTFTLTLRLLKEGKQIEDAFKDFDENDMVELTGPKIGESRAFAGQVYSNPPDWAKFLSSSGISDIPAMRTSGAAAIIFYPVGAGKRTIAVCFGHSHIPLDLDVFERQFGLRVTLNVVPRGKLRTLDIATPDAVTFQRRIQASKDSDIREFGSACAG